MPNQHMIIEKRVGAHHTNASYFGVVIDEWRSLEQMDGWS